MAMQVNELVSEGLLREYQVIFPANDFAELKKAKLQKISKTAKVPGFRDGKVPVAIIEKKYANEIFSETLDDVLQTTTLELLKERKLNPVNQPELVPVTFEDGKDIEYTFKMEIFPEAIMPDLSKITIEKEIAEVSDEEIEEQIQTLAKSHKHFEKIEDAKHKAQNGEAVLIDFVGKLKPENKDEEAKAFPGGSAKNHELELGSGQFIPGFEEQLVGVKVGDVKEVEVIFPTEYHAKDLAGKPVIFTVTVHEIRKNKPHEIDDAMAKEFGFNSIPELKDAIKKHKADMYANVSRDRMKKRLFDALEKELSFEMPQSIFKQEFENLWNQAKAENEKSDTKKSEEELKAEYEKITARRVRLGILFKDYARENNITVSENELQKALANQARAFPGQEHLLMNFYKQNPERLDSLRGPILEDKVIDSLFEKIKLKEKNITSKKLLELAEEDDKLDQ